MATERRLWVTWERQRRSVELARALGAELVVIERKGVVRRYVRSLLKTLAIVVSRRPSVLFVQNPSMVLAAFACVVGPVLGMPVVVDRHTTFLLGKDVRATARRRLFWTLHRYTLRRASLTIVTNERLAELVRAAGGRPAVLPDPTPTLRPSAPYPTAGDVCLVFPASYGEDEPLDVLLEACRRLPPSVHVYITGNYRKRDEGLPSLAPANVTFTGFLTEQNYVDLLFSAHAVVALTTAQCTMLCACYEALAAGKALITSDMPVLRGYFDRAIFVKNTPESILEGIKQFLRQPDDSAACARAMQRELSQKWAGLYGSVSDAVGALVEDSRRGRRR